MKHRRGWLIAGAAFLVATGCETKQTQLESVARDWCMTIRASQVIPVYPLTQDVQPGDVFLVQVPIDKQQDEYEKRGFLALDNHLARLDPGAYGKFYARSFLSKPGENTVVLPTDWMRPAAANGTQAAAAWSMAPSAAFPTYSFSVNTSSGLNLAVPISGVPIGLSLLGARAANGSVTIDDSHTFGVDIISLDEELRVWAKGHRDFLANFGRSADGKSRNFLRVITRVYLTGKLDVALHDASSAGGGVDAGMPRPIASMLASPPVNEGDVQRSAIDNYRLTLEALNKMLEGPAAGGPSAAAAAVPGASVLPGGSVRFTGASSRSISMSETFNPPLVIGYLGFDVVIRENGELGSPIPTHALLEDRIDASASQAVARGLLGDDALLDAAVFRKLQERTGDPQAKALTDALDNIAQRALPGSYHDYQWCDQPRTSPLLQGQVPPIRGRKYADLRAFITNARRSLTVLDQALAEPDPTLMLVRGSCEDPNKVVPTEQDRMQLINDRAYLRAALESDILDVELRAKSLEAQEYYIEVLRAGSTGR